MSQSGISAGGTSGGRGNAGGIEDRPDAGLPGVNICSICNGRFRTLEDYQQHIQSQHPGTTDADAASATGLKVQRE